jgi:hypothetical protein
MSVHSTQATRARQTGLGDAVPVGEVVVVVDEPVLVGTEVVPVE